MNESGSCLDSFGCCAFFVSSVLFVPFGGHSMGSVALAFLVLTFFFFALALLLLLVVLVWLSKLLLRKPARTGERRFDLPPPVPLLVSAPLELGLVFVLINRDLSNRTTVCEME